MSSLTFLLNLVTTLIKLSDNILYVLIKISDFYIWPILFHVEIYSTKTDIFGNWSQVLYLRHYPNFNFL